MVFIRCTTCRVLTTLFILLICASLYFRKDYITHLRKDLKTKFTISNDIKENLGMKEPTKEHIDGCEKQNMEDIGNNGNNGKTATSVESMGKAQCTQFLQNKCTYANCKTGVEVLPFNMNTQEDSISYAKSCMTLCNTRCKFLETCTKRAANKDPYNVSMNSDSVSETF